MSQNALDRVANRNTGQPQSIGALIQQLRPEMQRALPKHMDADRMARIALTVLRKTPALQQCTPESFMGALLTASQLGLEFGAANEAYITPYSREAQLIIGYQGYAKLFYQHPLARFLDSQAVYANDAFDYGYGTEPFLTHKPARGDRGELVCFYAVAGLTTGATQFVVLSPAEVRALRGGKVGSSGGIADPQRWMERKTAIRQVLKLLPKSPTLAQAMVADEVTRTDLRESALEVPDAPAAVEGAPAGVNPATGELPVQEPPSGGEDW